MVKYVSKCIYIINHWAQPHIHMQTWRRIFFLTVFLILTIKKKCKSSGKEGDEIRK